MFDENEVLTNDQINDLIKSMCIAASQVVNDRSLLGHDEIGMLKALIRLQVEKTGIEWWFHDCRTPTEIKEMESGDEE